MKESSEKVFKQYYTLTIVPEGIFWAMATSVVGMSSRTWPPSCVFEDVVGWDAGNSATAKLLVGIKIVVKVS